jgi:hypothetical protein
MPDSQTRDGDGLPLKTQFSAQSHGLKIPVDEGMVMKKKRKEKTIQSNLLFTGNVALQR